jgi:hypothetical protein
MEFILSWYKNIHYFNNYMKEKKDERELSYSGSELADKTIGIIGVGAIGQKVAKYCNAFGMKVLGYVRKKADTEENIEFVDLDTLYMKSDIVTIHVSLNDETRHMINNDSFKKLKTSKKLLQEKNQIMHLIKFESRSAPIREFFENIGYRRVRQVVRQHGDGRLLTCRAARVFSGLGVKKCETAMNANLGPKAATRRIFPCRNLWPSPRGLSSWSWRWWARELWRRMWVHPLLCGQALSALCWLFWLWGPCWAGGWPTKNSPPGFWH